ncbi:MAG: prepilin-type N-terminal cleavage/methylation domain-containing protein [Deltaproteobacteria bacterium]|nr:prepilin-type N-terminal cleavage/methylation domain-containing protein [Deltaproteobacteria bacterium]
MITGLNIFAPIADPNSYALTRRKLNNWNPSSRNHRSADLSLRQQRGFSLVEILIVIAIVSLLAAIGIPQFITYRSKGIDAQMKSDLRNAAVAVESYFAKNGVYPSSTAVIAVNGFQGTQGVTLSLSNITANSYQLSATTSGGSQASFSFDSTSGAIQ